MDVELLDKELSKVKGYRGSAILNHTGDCIQCNLSDFLPKEAEDRFLLYNDIFKNIHINFKKLNIEPPENIEIETSDRRVIIVCSGEEGRVHLHIIVIFDKSVSVGKILTQKVTSRLIDSLYS